jgi:hypothetical protein
MPDKQCRELLAGFMAQVYGAQPERRVAYRWLGPNGLAATGPSPLSEQKASGE